MTALAGERSAASVRTTAAGFAPVVIIPTFDHAGTVVGVAERSRALGLRVIVVNDGSTDDTAGKLRDWALADPANSDVVTHTVNQGKAAALASGFARARELGATHAATIDADAQLEPEDIPALLGLAQRRPDALILGSRPEAMEGCPGRCRTGRSFASLGVLAQCGLRLRDSQCGLRVYPLSLVERVRCHAGRFAFEAEFIARAAWAGAEVIEAPVRCRYLPPGERVSHWNPWRDSVGQAFTHFRLLGRAMLPLPAHPRRASAPPRRWRRVLDWINPLRSWRDVRREQLGPLELASALSVGAFIGSLPFFGFHTLLSLYVAWRLHQQPAAVVLGSQVSMPPVGVALGAASITVGHLMLTGRVPDVHIAGWRDLLAQSGAWMLDWTLGSIVVGAACAAVAFLVGLGIASLARPVQR